MVRRRNERQPSKGVRVIDAYGSSSPAEIEEATACASYDHRCPRCGAEVEVACRALVGDPRPLRHPHEARLRLPSAEEVVAYIGR